MARLLKLYMLTSVIGLYMHGYGQDTGIIFRSNLSWDQVLTEAKAENKFIFVDCYASWCAPCKVMDQKVYSQKEAGDYFNARFISIRLQMDRTPNDDQQTKTFYPIADSIATRFAVNSFPAFIFFSPDGMAVHKFIGATQTAQEFIRQSADALDPEKQYFTILSKLSHLMRDSALVSNAILAAKNAGDDSSARSLANDYISLLKRPITKHTIELVDPYILFEHDKGFEWYLRNASEIDQVLDEKLFAEETLTKVIFNEQITHLLSTKEKIIKWNPILQKIKSKYPALDEETLAALLGSRLNSYLTKQIVTEISNKEEIIQPNEWHALFKTWRSRFPDHDIVQILLTLKMRYYYRKHLWEQCAETAIVLIGRYHDLLSPRTVNDIIWDNVFLHSENKRTLNKALQDMKDVVERAPEDMADMDTYANLLYKTGHKSDAIEWENKAINTAQRNHFYSRDFETTRKTMEDGGTTWGSSSLN
jgi:thiol-disulfide isomerase/thioredoxin